MPLANKHHLELDFAQPSDAEAIAAVYFAGFNDHPYWSKMMPDTPEARLRWAEHIIYCLNDPYSIVLKVTDSQTNEIIGMGVWVKPKKEADTRQPGCEDERYPDEFMACCDKETKDPLFGSFKRNRESLMGDRPHYKMEWLSTSGLYKGKGAGSLILRHGCALADKEGLECYIDASPRGKQVYEKFGFEFLKEETLPMGYRFHFGVRPPQTGTTA